MRSEFLLGLAELADHDPRVVLITADLGFGSIEVFRDRHPDRFFNVGVAEQAMLGIATGLAEGGYLPYCYSIAAFSISRTFEFIRNGPIAHDLPVRVIGIGPGFDYSQDGMTHYGLEDVSLVLSQPGAMLIAPADADRARFFAQDSAEGAGFVYYRLARNVDPVSNLEVGNTDILCGCLVLCLGDATKVGNQVAEGIRLSGQECQQVVVEVVSQVRIRSLARQLALAKVHTVVVVENHYVNGGLGTYLSDALMSIQWFGTLIKWGVEALPNGELGDLDFMSTMYCTSVSDTISAALLAVSRGEACGPRPQG